MTSSQRYHRVVAAGLGICVLLACHPVRADEIHDAIRVNDSKAVRRLLDADPNKVNSRGENAVTPLHEAVRYGDAEMVKLLIARGADVKARCYNEFTPLHLTTDVAIARVLIRSGADPKATSSVGTVLEHAVQDENIALIDVLLESGETLSFEQLVELERTDSVAKMLKEQPWLAKAPRKCLHAAASNGHLEIARLLLDNGADPNHGYEFINASGNFSPLSNAVLAGHYEIARLLCERGAEMDVSGGKNYESLFHQAVADRDLRFVRLMLEHGADVDSRKHYAMTPLHVAANVGDVEKCRLLLRHGADVNARTPDGATPLMFAMVSRHDEVCELLLSSGAQRDVHVASALGKTADLRRMLDRDRSLANDRDKRLNRTPLFWAAERGQLEAVQLLIRYGAEVNGRALPYGQAGNVVTGPSIWNPSKRDEGAGDTPLHRGAAEGHTTVVRALLENGANVGALDADGVTPLLYSVAARRLESVKLLLEKSVDVDFAPLLSNACDSPEITQLLLARRPGPGPEALDGALRCAAGRDAKVVELLLGRGARADFHTACILGQSGRVAELLAADPTLVETPRPDFHPNERPLVLAAEQGHAATVALLLDKGALLASEKGTSALGAAAGRGQLEAVKLLLSRGADIDRKDYMGQTPLHLAASGGHLDTVALLIERGARILATDVYHATALHSAASAGAIDTARALVKAGIPVDCRNEFRDTPLHKAAGEGQTGMAAFLLEAGADVNARNRRGKTPLYDAEREFDPAFAMRMPDRKPVAALLRAQGGVK